MAWFKREKKGIITPTEEKKETPEGLWYKTPTGKIVDTEELRQNLYVSPEDDFHVRIGSEEYFQILFDEGKYKELNKGMKSGDPLKFQDTKKYSDRLSAGRAKTGLNDALRSAHGKLDGHDLVVSCMDFGFIGGSMGSVVGEKIARAIDYSLQNGIPFMIISKSGGARMMEAGFSLMQMAKTSAKLSQLAKAKIPFISLLTDPTTGGVTASYAMLGDVNIAEPGALIGFAGPRVIKETIGKDLPEGFQTSEFLLEHGFLDFIVHRKELKEKLSMLLTMFKS
jgi:acetyl-CoA carboxylase carboxyl transferase subunit beta